MDISELAKNYKALQDKHESLTKAIKDLNAECTEAENALLEAMVEEGVKSINVDGVGLLSMVNKSYLSVNAANKPGFYEYLKESGNGSLLKEDVNPRTLTAFLRGHLEDTMKLYEQKGMDEVDARKAALDFLNEKGASYFSERSISLRSKA